MAAAFLAGATYLQAAGDANIALDCRVANNQPAFGPAVARVAAAATFVGTL